MNFNLEIDLDRFRSEVSTSHRILDYGCSYGRISKFLRDSGYRNIVGIDSSIKMIGRGKRKFPDLHLDLAFEEILSFPNNSFDAIVVCAVFTYITTRKPSFLKLKSYTVLLSQKGCYTWSNFFGTESSFYLKHWGSYTSQQP